mgnify:CR=1 FL=1
MFHEDIAKEASEKGTQALISLGYTEKGGYYRWKLKFFGSDILNQKFFLAVILPF